MRYSWKFVLRRVGLFFLIIWSAATLNFIIPKLTPRDPLREKLLAEAARTGYVPPGFDEMVKAYQVRFGLDLPLWKQYVNYITDLLRLDLGYSIANYPKTTLSLIAEALPWTIGSLTVAVIIAFILGTLLGALMGWEKSPFFVRHIMPLILVFGAVPAFIIGLILFYFLAFRWQLLPLAGGFSVGKVPGWNWSFFLDIVKHSILPATTIVVTSAGGWAIGMRGMMVTVMGEDYMTFGEAKGLTGSRLFYRYGIRNAILPQMTGLALAISYIVSGSVLVELVCRYPGIGTILQRAINQLDYGVIYGIVFVLTVSLAFGLLIIDLIYPLLDPRINYE
ncbi:MAG: ABC transporter permease [Chloroflexota bacterium]